MAMERKRWVVKLRFLTKVITRYLLILSNSNILNRSDRIEVQRSRSLSQSRI